RLREEPQGGRRLTRYALGQRFGSGVDEAIEPLIRGSASFSDFEKSVQSLIATTTEEAAKSKGQVLTQKINTFSGGEVLMPKNIKNLVQKLSAFKVLYLRERRRPIGKEEAERLLSLKVRRGGPEVLRNIQATVAVLLGVQIDAFSASEGEKTTAEMDVDNFL